jgi:two-component system response regulator YesN
VNIFYEVKPLSYLTKKEETFDAKLAKDCAKAFASSTGIGTIVTLAEGEIISEYGNGCASCKICELAGIDKDKCVQSHTYGMKEAERFGGKYIYFCVMGLTCFVSPIVGAEKSEAKITVGPFLMVDQSDYINYELYSKFKLDSCKIDSIRNELSQLPYIAPEKVSDLSTLLFMSVGFINNVSAANDMLDTQLSFDVQNHIYSYINKLKGVQDYPPLSL